MTTKPKTTHASTTKFGDKFTLIHRAIPLSGPAMIVSQSPITWTTPKTHLIYFLAGLNYLGLGLLNLPFRLVALMIAAIVGVPGMLINLGGGSRDNWFLKKSDTILYWVDRF